MAVNLVPNLYAHWKLNESTGTLVSDSSANGRDGTTVNMDDTNWVAGKLNNCLTYDGSNEYVDCGDIANFERTESFSAECWFKTNAAFAQDMISRAESSLPYKGWGLQLNHSGILYFFLINSTSANNYLQVYIAGIDYSDNVWHHVIMTYDGSSFASGVHIYIDGVDKSLTILKDTLTATTQNSEICSIGSRSGGIQYWKGYLDEAVIYDKELSQEEVTFRWNGGAGTEEMSEVPSPPTAPSNPDPIDTATDIPYNQDLDWDSDGDTFDIYFGTSSPPVLYESDHPSPDYALPDLNSCTLYYWKIIAKNAGGETSGPEWSFTTGNELPITPYSPTPNHDATGQNLALTLEWENGDYNPNDTVVYDVYFGKTSPPPLIQSSVGSNNYSVSGLDNDQDYYWKIVARDNASCGTHETVGPIWKFRTKSYVTGGYTAFDPRKIIRSKLATFHKIDGELEECIDIVDNKGKPMYIPMYVEEESSLECPPLPFIRLDLLAIRAVPHGIKAEVRQHKALIGIDIAFDDMDNIDVTSFGKKVADRIVDLTRYYQIDTDGVQFYNVGNQGRIVIENRCEKVVFHWVLELEATFNDAC